MFDRPQYKKMSLSQLKGRWSVPVLATFASFAIFAILSIPDMVLKTGLLSSLDAASLPLSVVTFLVPAILIEANATVYLKIANSRAPVSFNDFLDGFSKWVKGIMAYLWYTLWVFMWSLLFLIPGIVKGISYSQMFYIIAEYPDLGVRKAMQISKIITNGHKMDLFIMCLSFIGWQILCVITCGIGNIWLVPYMATSYANAYNALKKEALTTGVISERDFLL